MHSRPAFGVLTAPRPSPLMGRLECNGRASACRQRKTRLKFQRRRSRATIRMVSTTVETPLFKTYLSHRAVLDLCGLVSTSVRFVHALTHVSTRLLDCDVTILLFASLNVSDARLACRVCVVRTVFCTDPTQPVGVYTGHVTVTALMNGTQPVTTTLTVALTVTASTQNTAAVLNGGADDAWRMSRLSWLDSTLGIDRNTTSDGDRRIAPVALQVRAVCAAEQRIETCFRLHRGDSRGAVWRCRCSHAIYQDFPVVRDCQPGRRPNVEVGC